MPVRNVSWKERELLAAAYDYGNRAYFACDDAAGAEAWIRQGFRDNPLWRPDGTSPCRAAVLLARAPLVAQRRFRRLVRILGPPTSETRQFLMASFGRYEEQSC